MWSWVYQGLGVSTQLFCHPRAQECINTCRGLVVLLRLVLSCPVQDQPRMYGGLVALRVLARKYEFKADVSWQGASSTQCLCLCISKQALWAVAVDRVMLVPGRVHRRHGDSSRHSRASVRVEDSTCMRASKWTLGG